ncbi:hypothetical protein HON01_09850 [Candidatus Woesearchaeota archaeon]|nr:hypothetical protein [Candidatus Woesearchaeota archaeon]
MRSDIMNNMFSWMTSDNSEFSVRSPELNLTDYLTKAYELGQIASKERMSLEEVTTDLAPTLRDQIGIFNEVAGTAGYIDGLAVVLGYINESQIQPTVDILENYIHCLPENEQNRRFNNLDKDLKFIRYHTDLDISFLLPDELVKSIKKIAPDYELTCVEYDATIKTETGSEYAGGTLRYAQGESLMMKALSEKQLGELKIIPTSFEIGNTQNNLKVNIKYGVVSSIHPYTEVQPNVQDVLGNIQIT